MPLYEALMENSNADAHELASFARLASVAAERSGDTPRAYQYAERALTRQPSEESVARAEAIAERAGTVPQLAEVLARLLANESLEKSAGIALRSRLVHILRDRLARPQDALVVLREHVEYVLGQSDINRDYVAGSLRELETLADRLGDLDAQRDVLEQSYENVRLISEIGKEITHHIEVEEVIDTVYAEVNKLMPAEVFGIGIFNKKEK